MKRKLLIWTAIAVSLVVEVYFLLHLPSILLALMFAMGKSECSFQKTIDSTEWRSLYYDSENKMANSAIPLKRDGDFQLWKTARGNFWIPVGGEKARFNMLAEQEMNVYGSADFGIHPGDVVIDCGADIGTFTRWALDSGASLVVAVEPLSAMLPCLQRNFQQEIRDGKVRIYSKGVWNKIESLYIYGMSVVLRYSATAAPTEVIQLTTIDNLVSDLELERVDFIKMDIEGAEKQALEGARKTLIKFKPRLAISCEHHLSDAKEIPRLVLDMVQSYSVECGPCLRFEDRFYPFAVNFH